MATFAAGDGTGVVDEAGRASVAFVAGALAAQGYLLAAISVGDGGTIHWIDYRAPGAGATLGRLEVWGNMDRLLAGVRALPVRDVHAALLAGLGYLGFDGR